MKKDKRRNKGWKKYFLEFFMLFLAVFLGFLADNILVNITQNNKEKKYIQSLISDVLTDKKNIIESIELNKLRVKQLDSLSTLCYEYRPSHNVKEIYKYFLLNLSKQKIVKPTNRTMAQLKSTGAMRLIKNKESINEILNYERQKNKLKNQGELYLQYYNKQIEIGITIFNLSKLFLFVGGQSEKSTVKLKEITLLKNDKSTLTKFANIVTLDKNILQSYIHILKETDRKADNLIRVLKDNYKLK